MTGMMVSKSRSIVVVAFAHGFLWMCEQSEQSTADIHHDFVNQR